MKKINSNQPLLFLALLFLFFSCKKDLLTTVNDESTNLNKQAKESLTVQKVSYKDFLKTVRSEQLGTLKEVLFKSEVTGGVNNFSVKVNSEPEMLLLMDQIKKVKTNNFTTYTVPLANKASSLKEFKNLLISEKGNETIAILITYKPDESWIKAHNKGLYIPFHGKVTRKVVDLKANKSVSKAGGISVATVYCQPIQVVSEIAVSCNGTGVQQHWPGEPCQNDGVDPANAPHYKYVSKFVQDCQDDGTPLPPESWRQAPVEVTPIGPIVHPPTEPTPPPPPCLAGIDGTCDGSTPPPPPPISLSQFLIEELAITNSNHQLLLNFYENLASQIFVFLQASGYTFENIAFINWAFNYKLNSSNTDFNELLTNKTDFDTGTGDLDNNILGGYDLTQYSDFDAQQDWSTISNVIPKTQFIGWNRTLYPTWECMQYATEQIRRMGYQKSDYLATGQTFQIYTSQNGVNQTKLSQGLSYLKYALSNNIPVIVGVDNHSGSSNPKTDNTTDHFIVIVGMGTDTNGKKYFSFYDNASGIPDKGAHQNNRLYYNSSTGLISGTSQATPYATGLIYTITMIRKSKTL